MNRTRRLFLTDLGVAGLGIAVFGAACSSDSPQASPSSSRTSTTPGASSAPAAGLERVDLGFVSAYLVIKSGEATVVDTGVAGSEGDIEAALTRAGYGWANVANVVLTHKHPDHAGSLAAVVTATDAAVFAGAADVPAISVDRTITAVADGDVVGGLTVIETPGHTPGHISLLDPAGSGTLIAGDAINGAGGGVVGPNAEFTEDLEVAEQSVRRLATFAFDAVYFGHGDPVLTGADRAVAALYEG